MNDPRKHNHDIPVPSTPNLPNDICYRISRYLRDDKDALSQCLRISADFNKMVAPILYREVTLDKPEADDFLISHPDGHLFSMPVYAGFLEMEKRLAAGKASNMGYIRHVVVNEPLSWRSDELDQAFTYDRSKRPIASLRLNRPAFRWHPTTPIFDSDRLLGLWHRFPPAKIINCEAGARENFCFQPPDGVECRVIRFAWSPVSTMYDYARTFHSLKKMVFVIPGNEIWPDSLISYEQRRVTWTPLINSLRILAQDEDFQCGIIVVNCDGAGEETERRQGIIEAEIKTTYAGGKPVRHKGPVKQIRFLSLLEYLSTHDWSGEFTEEEVRPWTCLM